MGKETVSVTSTGASKCVFFCVVHSFLWITHRAWWGQASLLFCGQTHRPLTSPPSCCGSCKSLGHMEFLLYRNLFDTWLEHIHLSSDSLPNSIRWRCHVDVTYNSFLHVPSSGLLSPRGVPWSCRIHLGRPAVAAATLFITSSLAQGSLEGWGRLHGRRNAHSPGGGQRVQGAERSGVGPADLREKTNACC